MWRELIPKLRPWPESLTADSDNPNQLDGSAQDLALEIATTAQDSTARRRIHRRFVVGLGVLAVLVMSVLHFLPAADYLAVSYAAVVVALGVFLFLLAGLPSFALWLRLPIALIVSYLLYYNLYFPPQPALLLIVAVVLTFLFADVVATHLFRIRVTEVGDASRITNLRKLWRNRLNPFASQAKGLEYYWLLTPLCALTALLAYRAIPDPQTGDPLANSSGFSTAALLPLLLFVLLGPLTAFLHKRTSLRYLPAAKASIGALFAWLRYNTKQLRVPGIAQSPIVSPARRRLLIASVWIVLIAASAAHFHWGLARTRTAMFGDVLKVNLPPTLKWLLPEGHAEWFAKEQLKTDLASDGIDLDEMIDRGILHSEIQALDNDGLVEVDDVLVEPRQAMILERLAGAARERYLERLKKVQEERERNALFEAEEEMWRVAEERAQAQTQGWVYIPLMYAWLVVRPVSHVLVVVFFALLLPLPTLIAVVSQPLTSLHLLGLSIAETQGSNSLTESDWKNATERMKSSSNPIENESVFLGVNAQDRSPIIVPRSVFTEHMHLLGDSGSGKTSLGIAPLMAQLIAGGECSVVLLDMKGDDHSLLEAARIGAAQENIPFRWFTNELGTPTYIFNPLQQSFINKLTLYQRADILAAGLGLQHGTDYGRSYYSDVNSAVLHAAFEYKPDIGSFAELLEVINSRKALNHLSREVKKAATHVGTVVRRLADWEPLNATADSPYPKVALANAIDLQDVFHTPQVVAFHIASSLGTASSAEMGRLALYSLMSGAKAAGPKRKQVFLIIDEFQRIVSNNVELLLQTARSMNIGVILANQTLMDLKTSGVDLIPSVRANTRIKQVFAASDLTEQQETSATSGETVYHSKSWNSYISLLGLSMAGRMLGSKEEISPRLRPNEILAMTDHPQRSVLHIRRGEGYAQFAGLPFVMESAFHITPEEYARRRNASWEDRADETITPELRLPQSPEPEGSQDDSSSSDGPEAGLRAVESIRPTEVEPPSVSDIPPDAEEAQEPAQETLESGNEDLLSGFGDSYLLPRKEQQTERHPEK